MIASWQEKALKDYKGAVIKVSNWVPALSEASEADIQFCRDQAKANDTDFLILYVGRLEIIKGIDILLEAFSLIPESHARLAIVGEGPEGETLRKRYASDPRITFAGYRTQPAGWYKAADLVVIPSRGEPFGLVAVEAMRNGAPILASRTGGLKEIFNTRDDCLLEIKDARVLADSIRRHIAIKEAGRICRDDYDLSRFDRTENIRRVTAFYEDVIASKKR